MADRIAPAPPAETATEETDYTAAVYGSLLVTTLIAAQWRHDASTTFIGFSLLISVAVFWLAHVWAAIVDRRVHGRVGRTEVLALAGGEAPMLASAVVPTLLLGLAGLGVLSSDQAIGVALLASIVQLFLWGIAVGRASHSTWPLALAVATVDCLLGILVVVLKVIVLH